MESICCALNIFIFIIGCMVLPGLRTYHPANNLQLTFFFRAVRCVLILLILNGFIPMFHLYMETGATWAYDSRARLIVIGLKILDDVLFFSCIYFYVRFLELYLAARNGNTRRMKPVTIVTAVFCIIGICVLVGMRLYESSGAGMDLIPGEAAYWISHICGYVISAMGIGLLLRYARKIGVMDLMSLGSFFLFPVLISIVCWFFPDLHLLSVGYAVSLILIFVNIHLKQYRLLQENELELSKSQLLLMNSQIQPHFLYNTLNSIYVLCEKDSDKAREAIVTFSEYLRGKVKGIESWESIPFEQELDLVQHYLLLEKMRYQDELQIKYDIRATNFSLPSLSLQPLVENAIKHGLSKKPNGGTVSIGTIEKEDSYEVSVMDDGLEPVAALEEDGPGTHTGLQNVRKRLQILCGGTLQICARPEGGTEAVMRIPKGFRNEREAAGYAE